jgi:ATP-dependent protease HslVU (ClpYQ) peptidase subunit
MRSRYTLVNDQSHEDDPTPFADLDSSFLIGNRSGIYQVSGNMSVSTFEQYYAVGSGASYALGAMSVLYGTDLDAEAIARAACQAAIEYDVFCGGDLDVFSVAAAPERRRVARRRPPARSASASRGSREKRAGKRRKASR